MILFHQPCLFLSYYDSVTRSDRVSASLPVRLRVCHPVYLSMCLSAAPDGSTHRASAYEAEGEGSFNLKRYVHDRILREIFENGVNRQMSEK